VQKIPIRAVWMVLGFSTIASFSTRAQAADVAPATIDAWRDYIQSAEARLRGAVAAGGCFLKADEHPDLSARLQRGEVIVAPGSLSTPKKAPGGLIHDWIASAFVPGASLEDVLRTFRGYDAYKQIYKPSVLDSRELGGEDGGEKFSLIFRNRAIMSHTALETDYHANYTQLDEKRWYSVAYTTRIQEIENYGESNEHKLNVGEGTGYVWRMETIAKFEERDGGVYVDVEAIALSRNIPSSLRWVVDPMIRRISKRSLTAYLTSTRDAVMTRTELTAIRSSSAQSR